MTLTMPKARKRIMAEFLINEISGVDRPAQEGARAVLLKRDQGEPAQKDYCPPPRLTLATQSTDGHTHLLWIDLGDKGGTTSYGREPDQENEHSHPWTIDPATGRVVVHENHGHTHDVDASMLIEALIGAMKVADSPEDSVMADDAKVQQLEAEKADLAKRLERAEKVAALSEAERALFKSLSGDEAQAFLDLAPEARAARVAEETRKAADANPVVFKSADGTEYRKSDDPRLIALARKSDEDRELMRKARDEAAVAVYAKRAGDEIPHLPGPIEVRGALLKAVDGIKDEDVRKQALAAVVAGSNALAGVFVRKGTTVTGTEPGATADPSDQLDDLAKAYAKEHKVDFTKAYIAVLESDEGQALYNQIEIRS